MQKSVKSKEGMHPILILHELNVDNFVMQNVKHVVDIEYDMDVNVEVNDMVRIEMDDIEDEIQFWSSSVTSYVMYWELIFQYR